MKRRDAVLVPLALGAATLAWTQVPGRTYRVGYLGVTANNSPNDLRIWNSLWSRLRELGYNQGGNLVIEDRYSEGRNERYAEFAAEMVKLKADVVVVTSGGSARAVMAVSRIMPIVTLFLPDPIRSGLITSFARPGGQLTGVYNLGPELLFKQFELLKAAVPSITRIAVAGCPQCFLGSGSSAAELAAVLAERAAAARRIGVTLVQLDINAVNDFDEATTLLLRERAEALVILSTSVSPKLRERWRAFAEQHRLPTIGEFSFQDTMFTYGTDAAGIFRKGAEYVAKILGGAVPGELPMEQPTKFELVINLKMAKAMGLTIPQSLLLRADEVIQ